MKNNIENAGDNLEEGNNPEADKMTKELKEMARNIENSDTANPSQETPQKATEASPEDEIKNVKASLEKEYVASEVKEGTRGQKEPQKKEFVVEKPPQSTARKVLEGFYQVIGLTPHSRRKLKESFGVESKEDEE